MTRDVGDDVRCRRFIYTELLLMAETETSRSRTAASRQKAQSYWDKVTEGASLEQLWKQFHADARQSYALYSREVDWEEIQGKKPLKRWLHSVWAVFQSLLMKLSPARRVLLMVAMALVIVPLPATLAGASDIAITRMYAIGSILLFALLALELADRVTMKRDLEIAREIQRWLVPERPPSLPGAEVAFATRPANTVAGDYYDVLHRGGSQGDGHNDDRWLIVVADVAGKSMPAALLMATFQASLHTLLTATATLPELVSGLNRYACAHSQGGRRFTTALFAEYQPATHQLTYINAGHNAAILQRGNGAIEHLASSGLPLGIPVPDGGGFTYEEKTLHLVPSDTLVIFTDGMVEAVDSAGMEYGEERLLTTLSFPVGQTAAVTLERLFADVARFVGDTQQQDDMTCLVFHCS
jgi:serine phosphatase RsbU (regulator of sigma subunit)